MADPAPPCTLCGAPAVVRVWLPRGCACSDQRDQRLCPQHAIKCEPVVEGWEVESLSDSSKRREDRDDG